MWTPFPGPREDLFITVLRAQSHATSTMKRHSVFPSKTPRPPERGTCTADPQGRRSWRQTTVVIASAPPRARAKQAATVGIISSTTLAGSRACGRRQSREYALHPAAAEHTRIPVEGDVGPKPLEDALHRKMSRPPVGGALLWKPPAGGAFRP
ncbi:hypothetical protein BV898_19878 [Hypsibius exemplaris]|uniref:Uncharacterized protein n=1 Tax=Hypsibius exemplaris TaxID=2072580 RepID=A0A9X6RPW1_HYPEX|nr:hypothetical protein BV898_19878 [Hypsibius exemplaris]